MGTGGYGNAIERVIGQMPPNLQNVPGGGPPGSTAGVSSPPAGWAVSSAHHAPRPFAGALGAPFPLPFAVGNPFTRR